MTVTIEKIGRRHYFVGNTYPIKDQLRSAGCKWDPARKQWWTGKRATAEKFAGKEIKRKKEDISRKPLLGKVSYSGKNGGKARDYCVLASSQKNGGRLWLTVLDGSIDFWADESACRWIKQYDPDGYRQVTLASIRDFIAEKKREEAARPKPQAAPTGELLNSPPQSASTGEVVLQGCNRYEAGETLDLLVSDGERDKMTDPVEVPAAPNAKPAPAGRVRIAVTVTSAWQYTEDEAEDFDYFDRRFFASARAATADEAAPLIERRQKANASADAGKALAEAVKALSNCDDKPKWATADTLVAEWKRPVMVHTGSYPQLYIHEGQACYHVPGYFACDWDYDAVNRCGPIDADAVMDLVARCDAVKSIPDRDRERN